MKDIAIRFRRSLRLINQGAAFGGVWYGQRLITQGLSLACLKREYNFILFGIWLTHYFTLKRERQASEDKMKKELH
ncbi:hypothetical protein QM138_23880 [Enterobacter hormaechei]|nr:hypothetical protein [Enterobacter hormaechei]MDV5712704.1 hypothetical protein [Enterobacter hormaechei]